MPRIQLYVSDKTSLELAEIAAEKTAPEEKPNISKTAVELLEIGVRAYKYKRDNPNSSSFNQMLYNKEMMEMMAKSNFTTQKLIGMVSYMSEIQNITKFNFRSMVEEIRDDSAEVVGRHFVLDDEEE